MVDLGVCLEAIGRVIEDLEDITRYKKHREIIAFKDRLKHMLEENWKVMTRACPIRESRRKSLIKTYEELKETPWEFVEERTPLDIALPAIRKTLWDLAVKYGFTTAKWDKYLLEQ